VALLHEKLLKKESLKATAIKRLLASAHCDEDVYLTLCISLSTLFFSSYLSVF
jgi:hypothetical protein